MRSINRSDLGPIIELVTLVAVITGLTFAALELRQLREAQQAQTILALFEPLRSAEHVDAIDLVLSLPDGLTAGELLQRLSDDELRQITQVHATFEAVGVMVFRGDISLEWVDELYRYTAISTWEKTKQLTLERRKLYRGAWEWHQWLVERLLERNPDPAPAFEAYADWEE